MGKIDRRTRTQTLDQKIKTITFELCCVCYYHSFLLFASSTRIPLCFH